MTVLEPVLRSLKGAVVRTFRPNGETAAVVLTLSCAVAATSASFALIDSALIRPLPYRDAHQIVVLWEANPALKLGVEDIPVAGGTFSDWQSRQRTLSGLAAARSTVLTLTGRGEPVEMGGARVSGAFFGLLGVAPQLGRLVADADDMQGAPATVVLSHRAWQLYFGGDPAIVGQTITLNQQPVNVIGVARPGFSFPSAHEMPSYVRFAENVDAWMPLALNEQQLTDRGQHDLVVLGRLREGQTPDSVSADLRRINAEMVEAVSSLKGWSGKAVQLQAQVVGEARGIITLLFAIAVVVSTAAALNAMAILVVRWLRLSREVGIRAAVGASPSRLIGETFVDGLGYAALGGVVGGLSGYAILVGLLSVSPGNVARFIPASINVRLGASVVLLSLLLALLCGCAGWPVARARTIVSLLRGARSARTQRTQAGLLVAQLALSFLVVVNAAVLVTHLAKLRATTTGFSPDGVITAKLNLTAALYPNPAAQQLAVTQLMDRLNDSPGVTATAISSNLPMTGVEELSAFSIEGMALRAVGEYPVANVPVVTPNYFETLRIALVRGRLLSTSDNQSAPPAVVVNREFERQFFPGADSVGRRIKFGAVDANLPWNQIVGVVADVVQGRPGDPQRAQIYRAYAQRPRPGLFVIATTTLAPPAAADLIRSSTSAVNPFQAVSDVVSMDTRIDTALAEQRFRALLVGVLAAIGFGVAASGIYGLMMFRVQNERRPIAVRMALGVPQAALVASIVRPALAWISAGTVLGVGLTVLWRQYLSEWAVDILPPDQTSLGVAALSIAIAASLGLSGPLWSALRTDPLPLLRQD